MGALSCAEWLGWGRSARPGAPAGLDKSCVVPANAGTHTPRHLFCGRYPTPALSPISRGVWVPAQGRDDVDRSSQTHSFPISRLDLPEACYRISLPSNQRAQGMPGARCTRGLVCQKCALWRTRAYRAAEAVRHPLRNGFTAYFVLSPVERACCHRHWAENFPHSLTPASRRQDHTTSPYALAFSSGVKNARRQSVHHIPRPTCRDDHDTPLLWARDGRSYNSDFQNCEAKYFNFGA